MSSRLELELTSKKADDSWTWRKAGAKEPRGVLSGSILYDGAQVGDVVKAEVTFEIDGITVESVLAPQAKVSQRGILIEISPQRSTKQLSSVEYSKSNRSKSKGRSDKGDAFDSKDGSSQRKPRTDRPRNSSPKDTTGEEATTKTGERRRPDRTSEPRRTRPPEGASNEKDGARSPTRRPDSKPRKGNTFGPDNRNTSRADITPRFAKVTPGTIHRDSLVKVLPIEHLAIAEQLIAGGLPAVRTAIATQNQQLAKEGKPPMPSDPFLNIAEEILPSIERATWQDRADAVLAVSQNVGLRDLKTVVSFGERVAKGDDLLEILNRLKALLAERTSLLESEWTNAVEEALNDNKSIKAVRIASRAPDLSSQLAPELLQRLTEAANQTLSPSTAPEHWAAMLSALETSPIRKLVTPSGLPSDPPTELTALAQEMSGRIPNLASLLGIKMPPPPRARRRIGNAPGDDQAPATTKAPDTEVAPQVQEVAPQVQE